MLRNVLFVLWLGFLRCSVTLAADAPAKKIYRIGYLNPTNTQDVGYVALRQEFGKLGYVIGGDLVIDEAFAEGKLDRLPGLAADLVRLKVDIIVAAAPPAIRAARDATTTIPIVMAASGDDPVSSGFVTSLASPGGNITGVITMARDYAPKWIEYLREAIPGVRRIAVLGSPARPEHASLVQTLRTIAQPLGIQLEAVQAGDVEHYAVAFAAMERDRAEALIVLGDPAFTRNADRLAELAIKYRLPGIYQYAEFVLAGGLMSYGPDHGEIATRSARYVDKILKGAKPGEMAVEQPTRFVLAINMKTAKALGLTIPRSLRLRADEVIQ